MASIFTKDDNYVEKPNRNSFDLSFQNNVTLKFGKLIPVMCQEVIPGDSFRIKPTFGLRFLPQVFPVQTRMRAHLHFFYVRNRTIWKDWMDFIGKTKENLTPPFLVADTYSAGQQLKESSIYDYMGLPCVIESDENSSNTVLSSRGDAASYDIKSDGLIPFTASTPYSRGYYPVSNQLTLLSDLSSNYRSFNFRKYAKEIIIGPNTDIRIFANDSIDNCYLLCRGTFKGDSVLLYYPLSGMSRDGSVNTIQSNQFKIGDEVGYINAVIGYTNITNNDFLRVQIQVRLNINQRYPINGIAYDALPYGAGDSQMRINALPFRAYEAIYNSFYRNAENNPFKINGKNEYNKYVVSDAGGAQSFSSFSLFNRNWEDDQFTTALPTPQQGKAPRVGLTGDPTGIVTVQVYNEDGTVSNVGLMHDSNGRVILAGSDGTSDTPFVNAVNDAVNFGITINDLRNVNALQLWLEKNVRRGYKYKDQMMSHYGVKVDYNELMMPEFIGGVSRDVTVNQISQTVETSDGNLGDMAGQAYVVGDGHSVTRYCDEHGYIIGILSVVPVPNYSQLIPKHLFKHETFDYFFPEFGKIGMQPITCKEIAAMPSWVSGRSEETFGYQRAWYDYLANVDQVHGKFNSDFYDFLIQRKFTRVPELSKEFTTVINSQLNSIFYTKDDEDKILGQIYFDIKAIRPIPLYGIPSLEAA